RPAPRRAGSARQTVVAWTSPVLDPGGRARRARLRLAEAADDVRRPAGRRRGAPGALPRVPRGASAPGRVRCGRQDRRHRAHHAARPRPAPAQPRRAAAAGERARRRHDACRATPVPHVRVRAAGPLAAAQVPRQARSDRTLAGVRPQPAQLRRDGAPRLLLRPHKDAVDGPSDPAPYREGVGDGRGRLLAVDRVRVGIVGAGYWGPNLIRTFAGLAGCEVAWVCDRRPGRLQYIAERFPELPLTDQYDDLLADRRLDAIAIVTPPATHRALAEAALQVGKHVLVEKPLALTVEDAAALVEMADRLRLVLATGHVFVYHPAVAAIRDLARAGTLGDLCYAESDRVNLGHPDSAVDVIWDLAVHDVSVLVAVVGSTPAEVQVDARRWLHPTLTDVAFITLR